MKIQHLVLDDDVHKALKARKKKTGATVKEIGNSSLRGALSLPTKEDLVVEKLVGTGRVTRVDYDQAVATAEKEVRTAQRKAAASVLPTPGHTEIIVGSWHGREVYRSEGGTFHVLEHRARDGKKTMTPLHYHEHSHAWSIVLHGKVFCRTETGEQVVGPHECHHHPPGEPHGSAPLTRSTRLVLIMSPPDDVHRGGPATVR